MASPVTKHTFRNLDFQKSVDEIKEAMTKKVAFLEGKVVDRQARVVRIREEFRITDTDMIELLVAANQATNNRQMNMSYTLESGGEIRLLAAGVIQNLITEKTFIEQEQATIVQFKRICRNLKPVLCFGDNGEQYTRSTFHMGDTELEYLGF